MCSHIQPLSVYNHYWVGHAAGNILWAWKRCCCCQVSSRGLHRSMSSVAEDSFLEFSHFVLSPGSQSGGGGWGGNACMQEEKAGTVSLVTGGKQTKNSFSMTDHLVTTYWQQWHYQFMLIRLHLLSTIAAACILSPRCPRLQSLSPSAAKGLWHLHPTPLYISRTVNNPAKMCTELKIGGIDGFSMPHSVSPVHPTIPIVLPHSTIFCKAFYGLSGMQQTLIAFQTDTQTSIIFR